MVTKLDEYLSATSPRIYEPTPLFPTAIPPEQANLIYLGEEAFREPATQAAKIIYNAYRNNALKDRDGFVELESLNILIGSNGLIYITRYHDDEFRDQTRRQGLLLGMLMGIGQAKRKPVVLSDNFIHETQRPVRRGAALKFDSFADLAECVNVLAKSQDERIDVEALPKRVR